MEGGKEGGTAVAERSGVLGRELNGDVSDVILNHFLWFEVLMVTGWIVGFGIGCFLSNFRRGRLNRRTILKRHGGAGSTGVGR